MEDLLHRDPGDPSTLAPAEAAFAPLVRAWMDAERAGAAAAAAAAAAGSGPAQGASFTRVVVSSLKPEILAQIADDEGGQQLCRRAARAGRLLGAHVAHRPRWRACERPGGRVSACVEGRLRRQLRRRQPGPCFRSPEGTPLLPGLRGCLKGVRRRRPMQPAGPGRDLAHLYHYYLHGETGNRAPPGSQRAAPQAGRPAISVRYVASGREQWAVDLTDVADDLESRYLQARQRGSLQITANSPAPMRPQRARSWAAQRCASRPAEPHVPAAITARWPAHVAGWPPAAGPRRRC